MTAEKKPPRPSILDALYLADGVTLASEAAKRNGVSERALRDRLARGYDPDDAVRLEGKKPNAYERGEYHRPYDPTLGRRMGLALRALKRGLNSLASWERILAEAAQQREACAVSFHQVCEALDLAAADLQDAAECVQHLGPKDRAQTKADRSAINVAVHRHVKARERLSLAEKQAKGAVDRLAKAKQKEEKALKSVYEWRGRLLELRDDALPFKPWVMKSPDRDPALTLYLSGIPD